MDGTGIYPLGVGIAVDSGFGVIVGEVIFGLTVADGFGVAFIFAFGVGVGVGVLFFGVGFTVVLGVTLGVVVAFERGVGVGVFASATGATMSANAANNTNS